MNRASQSSLAPILNRNASSNGILDANGNLNNDERRRNTAPTVTPLPGAVLQTPPPTTSSSLGEVRIEQHASSEPRCDKPGPASLSPQVASAALIKQLPPLTGLLSTAKGSATARACATISRSARIALASSPATSTPTAPPTTPNVSAAGICLSPEALPRAAAARQLLTHASPVSLNVAGEAETPASQRERQNMRYVLKQFNARLLDETQKEKARCNRRISCASSREPPIIAQPTAHPPCSTASTSATKSSPLQAPLNCDDSGSHVSAPKTPTGVKSSPPRATLLSQMPPQSSPLRGNMVAVISDSSSQSSPSAPASVPRGPNHFSENVTITHNAASSPESNQGSRCRLPRAALSEPLQQTGPARSSPSVASPTRMPPSSTSASRCDANTPPILTTPRTVKAAVGKAQPTVDKSSPPPRTSPSAMPNLPDRYAPGSDADEKNARPPLDKPLSVPPSSSQSPLPAAGPVYSAVEIQEGTSLLTVSPGGRWGFLNDGKRPSASGSNGGHATADKTILATASSSSSTTTSQPARQPPLPETCQSHSMDELDNVGEEAITQQAGAKLSHTITGASAAFSHAAMTSAPSHNHDPSNRCRSGPPSRSEDLHDGGPHRLSNTHSNGAAGRPPLRVPPILSSTDVRHGKGSANSTASPTEAAGSPAIAKSAKPISSGPAAGQSLSDAAPMRAAPLTSGGSCGGTAQRPDSALYHNSRYSPARCNPSAGVAAGHLANEQHRSTAECTIPDIDAETAALTSYLKEEDLNLSVSTFNSVGSTLAQSLTLRVLNLKGSTISSEGLRGLADIPTLKSVCVSHMRCLTTLVPLVTPTARANGRPCGIEEIDAQFSPLTNEGIWGLERLRRLRRLDLGMTPISDVTCLAASHSLHDLHLTGTRVDSPGLAGLERLPTLVLLNVARTKVTSLKQIAKSRSIQTLIAYSCHIADDGLIGVGEMPRLSTLDVSTTKVTNLSVLQKSRSLKSLRAQWLSLKNCHDIIQQRRAQMDGIAPDSSAAWRDTEAGFAGLASIPTLESVDLSFNTIRSFHSLCRSKSLRHLMLRRTRVDNSGIGSIAQLSGSLETLVITNLTDILDESDDAEVSGTLNAAGGLLSTIGDIHVLRRLTSIDLSFTDVYDLRLLQDLRALRELVIVETLVTVDGLRGIEKIPTLETLDISQTSITSLQFLGGGAPALRKILVKSNRHVRGFKLGRIDQLRALQHLDISDTVVEDIEVALKPTWRLKTLIWRWKERRDSKGPAPALECWVTSPRLVGMNTMLCLTTLDLTNSSVHDLSFLEGCCSLKTLYLKCCRLLRNQTVRWLSTLAALEVLELTDNRHISDVTCLRACRRLRELRLHHTYVTKAGLQGVTDLPELKVLDIANTRAEDDVKDEEVHGALERSRLLEDSNVREGSTLLDSSAAPAQFRVPRRRRVSFIANDGGETVSRKQERCE
ncbi:hypothetical protein LSCM1_05776 [Leishmania martiniquensis]|uniref:Leucine-rich repeat protein n=1 Tax=Leishmania martiniquensis TaxID=1580590 RepID=A0A836KTD3_9TRYP|nr:hypothetical protein LSCM1_05776 [Leishmania martiniquensis]